MPMTQTDYGRSADQSRTEVSQVFIDTGLINKMAVGSKRWQSGAHVRGVVWLELFTTVYIELVPVQTTVNSNVTCKM